MKSSFHPLRKMSSLSGQYITLEKEIIHISKDEFEKEVKYKINFPVRLKPGQHTAEIWVVETGNNNKEEGSILVASLGVVHKLFVRVPYPDEYLEGILYISEQKDGGPITFTVSLSNIGTKDLNKIIGSIIITG